MKTITTSVVILSLFSNSLIAQRLYFHPANDVPVFDINNSRLSNAWAGGINFPIWSAVDMNGDGLADLYMYDRCNARVMAFINDGTAGFNAFHDSSDKYAPLFPSVYIGGQSYSPGWGVCYDFNCDGKADFFTISPLGQYVALYRNDYTATFGLKFKLVTSQILDSAATALSSIYTSSIYVPAFVDMDDDGDLDMLGFSPNPDNHIFYYRNYAEEYYHRCDTMAMRLVTKCWGNFALSMGQNAVSCFHCPCPPVGPEPEMGKLTIDSGQWTMDSEKAKRLLAINSPQSIVNSPFKAERDDTITSIFSLDVDGDGLKELLVGDQANSNSLEVHNAGTPQVAEADTEDINFPVYNTSIKDSNYVYHAYVDCDNDGIKDLIASSGNFSDKNNIWVYKNTGTDLSPIFNFARQDFIQGNMIDEGEAANAVFFDYDADGIQDLIIAHGITASQPTPRVNSKLSLYKNIGTATTPQFKFITDDYMGIGSYGIENPIAVTFGDLRCVGVQDMIIGDKWGNLYYFQNSSSAGQAANFSIAPLGHYAAIDVGNNATPQLVDVDNDGKLDLLVGAQSGHINYFHNNGTCASASFSATPTNSTFGNINVQWGGLYGFSAPYLYNNNGVHELLVSNDHGVVYYYDNIDGNLGGTFNLVDSFFNGSLGIAVSPNLTISGGDINNDGLTDLLVGLVSGGVQIYYGSHFSIGINEVNKDNPTKCFPNPASNSFTVSGLQFTEGQLVTISLFNALGQNVTNETVMGKSETTINVSYLPAGFYFVKISSTDKSYFQKILICR